MGEALVDRRVEPDGTIVTLVGDVAGHGPDEAGVAVALRVAWRTMVLTGHGPAELLAGLDQVLLRERRTDELFATVACVWVDPDRRRAYARGRHISDLRRGYRSVRRRPAGVLVPLRHHVRSTVHPDDR